MSRPSLPRVTLVCVDCRNHRAALRALAGSAARVEAARALFLTDRPELAAGVDGVEAAAIPALDSRDAYSRFMIKGLLPFVETDFALVLQWDGFIADPAAWSDGFLGYDYIGARWTWFEDGGTVGNGGFSLRSRRLLEALQDPRIAEFDPKPEDLRICRDHRPLLEAEHGIRFAPEPVADAFAYERTRPQAPTFGFHGLFNLWRQLDAEALAEHLALLDERALASDDMAELMARLVSAGRMPEAVRLYRTLRRFRTAGDVAATAKRFLSPPEIVDQYMAAFEHTSG